ncbi:MAG: DUF1127 domain-containing protein [Pseudaminobacter sp.]|nr:DUF1127 domain-containing protein [Pseudaminobacter sp.]
MTTLDHANQAMRNATRPAAVARAVEKVSSFIRAWRNRREFYRLGEMSDAELSDIGLTRCDLHAAVGPFGVDPTARLGSIVQARSDCVEDMARRVC